MTDILYKPENSDEWQWCCNVTDTKADQFVKRKNQMFQHGKWRKE